MKELIRLREVLYAFQTNSGLVGPNRSTVLEKCLAASIAYAAPCVVGDVADSMGYYRSLVQGNAMRIISAVNEICIVSTDRVLFDVQELWLKRYNTLNCPVDNGHAASFMTALDGGDQLRGLYELWVPKFTQATTVAWDTLAGGE